MVKRGVRAQIPEKFLDLFDKKSIAHLATLESDGTPHVTPVWVDYDGQYILVNSVVGRAKDRNMSERPSVALSITDPNNPYRYLAVQGTVVEITEAGARDHIDKLAQRYTGREKYTTAPGEVRRLYKIRPENVMTNG